MIVITPLEDYPDYVLSLPNAIVTPEQTRRITRTETLDGGVVVYDGGFNFGDFTLNISIPNITSDQHEITQILVQQIGRVLVSTSDGLFQGVIESYTGEDTGALTILVEKRTDNEVIPDPEPDPEATPFITSPPDGSTFSENNATFIWDPQTGAENYQLILKDGDETLIYDSGILPNTTLSILATGIPEDGRPITAFFYYKKGSWEVKNYYYWAVLQMTSPVIGSQLAGSTETFVWNLPHSSVDELWLWIGYTPGSNDIFGNNDIAPTETSLVVNDLPTSFVPPTDIYVTLYWYTTDYTGIALRKTYNFLSGSP